MSDSDASVSGLPGLPDSRIEKQLRREVGKRFDANATVGMTVNQIRQAAEQALKQKEGFFVTSEWKAESKRIISEETVGCFSCPYPPFERG